MPTFTLGLDPSSKKLAVTVLRNGVVDHCTFRPLPSSLGPKCQMAYSWTRKVVAVWSALGPVEFWIEEPVVGRGGAYATILQSRVGGASMAGAMDGGAVVVRDVGSSTWKKHVIGNGSMPKASIPSWVQANWPMLYNQSCQVNSTSTVDGDVIDSGCIAKYGF